MSADKPTVLAVDDDRDLLRLLTIRLTSAGYDVVAVESGEAALAELDRARPQLVITDLRMAGMDGMALFEGVQRRDPGLPVIMLTAHGTIPDAVAATKRGVFGYLTKPVDAKQLLSEVGRALALGGGAAQSDAGWRDEIVTRSPKLEEVLAKVQRMAASDAPVLIRGESGTGKELLARAVHRASTRHAGPFVAVNCGAIPEPLLESELFGYMKGAFTGATRDHRGLFAQAAGGTLFLDEIGDMPLALQVKLLRVLQEKEVRPLGAAAAVLVDVRVISATHRDLDAALANGTFREDLYYRLNVVQLALPSLAERREDIPLLAHHFLRALATKYGKPVNAFAPAALAMLAGAGWPGNVRQLYNVVEQAVALCATEVIPTVWVQQALNTEQQAWTSLEEARNRFERDYLVQLLKITEGNVAQAAQLAQRNRTEFYKLLARHRLDAAVFKPAKG